MPSSTSEPSRLDKFVFRAGDRGLLVMVDNHVPVEGGSITELWYDNDQWTEANVISTWQTLVNRINSKVESINIVYG